jgi:hypothetical protein
LSQVMPALLTRMSMRRAPRHVDCRRAGCRITDFDLRRRARATGGDFGRGARCRGKESDVALGESSTIARPMPRLPPVTIAVAPMPD